MGGHAPICGSFKRLNEPPLKPEKRLQQAGSLAEVASFRINFL